MPTEALEDVKEIIASRPDLSPDEWEVVEKATDWLRAQLKPQVRAELDASYAAQYATDVQKLREEQQVQIAKSMQDWKDSQKPLDQVELQKLLSQEYATLSVTLMVREKKVSKKREFTLVELPLDVEKKFLGTLKTHLIPMIEKMNAWDMRAVDANWSKILQQALDEVPGLLEIAAELVVTCLNPWNDDDEINVDWVRRNISSHRIVKIIKGQTEVNKYRDFYSEDFRLFRG